jgi:phosphate-selective porin OprO and OprP
MPILRLKYFLSMIYLNKRAVFTLITVLILLQAESKAQQIPSDISPTPYFSYGKGLGIISPDSLFMLNIRFRIQNRFAVGGFDDWSVDEVEARVRRLRLRFEGFIYSPRLTYVIQLGFSRGDMDDGSGTNDPQIIRDAMVIYAVSDRFAVGLGQTKLPGNRQRVNSSGDLQFADRSIVNSIFNIDRDFGVQMYYNNFINQFYYVVRGAVSSGEGRNTLASDNGLAYTARAELLPFGPFTNGGDYFEGDLAREPKPKVSVGVTFSENLNTTRSGGQTGRFLYESRNIETAMFDFLFKHNGWAVATEFIIRNTNDPVTQNELGFTSHVYKGHGENYQASYLWRSNYEMSARFSRVIPYNEIQTLEPERTQYTLGGSKYIRGHRLKLQTDLSYQQNNWLQGERPDTFFWQWRFQIEVGI